MTAQTWVLVLGVGSALLSIGAALVGLPSFRRPPPRGVYSFGDLKNENVTRSAEDVRAWRQGWAVATLALLSAGFAMGAAVVGFVAT